MNHFLHFNPRRHARRPAGRLLLPLVLLLLLLLSGPRPALAQNINRAEFFVDTDPGFGLGTTITLPATPAPGLNNLAFQVPLGTLAPGFHSLNTRTRTGTNDWSQTFRRVFYLDDNANITPNLSQLEVFVNTDPGFGRGTKATLTGLAAGPSFVVPLGALPLGFHRIFFRSQDARGQWSQTQLRTIFVDPATLSVSKVHPSASSRLFPNPAAHTATLEVSGLSATTAPLLILLTNALGQEVGRLTAPVRAGVLRAQLPVGQLPTGMYLVRIQTQEGFVLRRLMRE